MCMMFVWARRSDNTWPSWGGAAGDVPWPIHTCLESPVSQQFSVVMWQSTDILFMSQFLLPFSFAMTAVKGSASSASVNVGGSLFIWHPREIGSDSEVDVFSVSKLWRSCTSAAFFLWPISPVPPPCYEVCTRTVLTCYRALFILLPPQLYCPARYDALPHDAQPIHDSPENVIRSYKGMHQKIFRYIVMQLFTLAKWPFAMPSYTLI